MTSESGSRSLRLRALVLHRSSFILALILITSFVMKLPNLGHRAIKPLDEVFHAIVAANLLKHPLKPTLNDRQYLQIDYHLWQNTHIWLHKPPMAMWQIAASYALLGVNTLALRLPSAILATLAVWLTYLIGKELIDQTAGLIAAALQAFNAPIAMLVHGNVFSDHIDIALLFWVEVAIWLLIRAVRSGRQRDWVLCGIAQGLAFLSKTYPALIVTVVAIVALVLNRRRVPGRRMVNLLLGTIAVVAPWTLWCLFNWKDQFLYENLHALRHLSSDVEGWAAPWDRLVFDFWIRIFHVYYPAVLVAGIVVMIRAWRLGDWRLGVLAAWGIGVLVPHLLATSKTMTATLIGWPAMWIMLGYLISQAIGGCGMSAGAWAAAMVLPLVFLSADDIPMQGWGYPESGGFGAIMLEHVWVVWMVLASLVAGVIVAMLRRRWIGQMLCIVAAGAMLVLAVRWWDDGRPRGYAYLAWRVKEVGKDRPSFVAIGRFARTLPPNAAFMVDEQTKLENKLIQFVADRTCYPLPEMRWQEMGSAIIEGGGLPYLITDKAVDLPVVFVDDQEGRKVYACTPAARSAAEHGGGVLLPQ
ncbi:ArnT family glycosyltransferase [Fontivita pretiosa]|uniref:ArnT family glycosyltransferase n=1 Tax=Fontivita pretiosa TaxID=2989684 RepID=UPI003D182D24